MRISGTDLFAARVRRKLWDDMQRKVFWLSFIILSLIADFTLPLLWAVLATLPITALS
jgi:hypothetical protein